MAWIIRKKLYTQYLRDMTQLADRVLQVEHLKAEKARTNKYHKKEKVAYVKADNYPSYIGGKCIEESEVNVAEIMSGPSYVCKLSKP